MSPVIEDGHGIVCSANSEAMRAAGCEDDEVAVHIAMHLEGLCPQRSEDDLRIYQERVFARRHGEPGGRAPRICESDEESLRAEGIADDEITIHLAMHTEGLCPLVTRSANHTYRERVSLRRGTPRPQRKDPRPINWRGEWSENIEYDEGDAVVMSDGDVRRVARVLENGEWAELGSDERVVICERPIELSKMLTAQGQGDLRQICRAYLGATAWIKHDADTTEAPTLVYVREVLQRRSTAEWIVEHLAVGESEGPVKNVMDQDEIDYQVTRDRVISGRAAPSEARDFIEFIEGAVPGRDFVTISLAQAMALHEHLRGETPEGMVLSSALARLAVIARQNPMRSEEAVRRLLGHLARTADEEENATSRRRAFETELRAAGATDEEIESALS